MNPANAITLIWGAWFILWILLSRGAARTRHAESPASRAVHLAMVSFAFVLLLTPYPKLDWLSVRILPRGTLTLIVGYAIFLAGIGTSIWARVLLGRNWSASVTIKEGHQLIRSGPYALVRHPIYTGIITAMMGSAVVMGEVRSVLAAAIFAVAYVRKIPIEEATLARHFAASYADYRRRTKAVFPFIL